LGEEMQAKQRGSVPHLPICDSRPHPGGREKRSSKHHVSMQNNIQMLLDLGKKYISYLPRNSGGTLG
jgi:hypothetical protein